MHLLRDIFFLLHLISMLYGAWALKNVDLEIKPRVVTKGEYSVLTCLYDLEGAKLYTAKWYRGIHEFYRYTPSEHPNTKIFHYKGIHIDLDSSNERQVVLQDVGFNLSGKFSCEVTTEEPFSTAVASKDMLVVVYPERPPMLHTDKGVYMIGDILRANCTSPPARPAATLSYFMNNHPVCEKCETRKHADGDLFASELVLELPLFQSHMAAGRLMLRCVAQIAELYQQDTEIRLDNAKDPVPERVTYPNAAHSQNAIEEIKTVWCRLGIFLYLVLNYR